MFLQHKLSCQQEPLSVHPMSRSSRRLSSGDLSITWHMNDSGLSVRCKKSFIFHICFIPGTGIDICDSNELINSYIVDADVMDCWLVFLSTAGPWRRMCALLTSRLQRGGA